MFSKKELSQPAFKNPLLYILSSLWRFFSPYTLPKFVHRGIESELFWAKNCKMKCFLRKLIFTCISHTCEALSRGWVFIDSSCLDRIVKKNRVLIQCTMDSSGNCLRSSPIFHSEVEMSCNKKTTKGILGTITKYLGVCLESLLS